MSYWLNTPRRIASLILAVVVIITVYFMLLDAYVPNTDDATVNAYVIQVASIDAGKITQIYAKDNAWVKAGDPLFSVENSLYTIALQQAQADAAVASNQFDQMKILYAEHAIGKDVYLNYQKANADAAQTLATAQYNLDHVTVYAPSNGYVTHLQIQAGSYVTAGGVALTFVNNTHWWVDANFKENNLARIHPGQTVLVSVNTQPGYIAYAKVDSISWGVDSGEGDSTGLLPTIDKTENWIRLAQRFPVRVELSGTGLEQLPLRVGGTAIVTIYTTDSPFLRALGYWNQWVRTHAQFLY